MRSGLLPEARHLVLPKGIVATGFPRVEATCRSIGIEFDPWQVDLNKCLLAKTADDLYAADTAVISIARQVGKTFDVGAVAFAECIAVPGTTVVWTAHRFKVARETFNELRGLAKSPKLGPHLDFDAITTAAGNESIPFRNGSRIVFAARERGAIRGFTKVRILVLDEAQILTEAALSDLAPTMNQAENPLVILMGTPPKPTDPSEVFTGLREDALAGTSEGVLYVELSADPGSSLDDRQAWAKANPSYPSRTSARAILRLRKLLSDDDFAREALGIWDGNASKIVIPASTWAALAAPTPLTVPPAGFAVDMTPDRTWTSIGVYCDGHVDVVEHRRGAGWLVESLRLLTKGNAAPVGIDTRGAAATEIQPLRDAGVNVLELNTTDSVRAAGSFYDAVITAGIHHPAHPDLDAAVKVAVKRAVGDGWAWDRRAPTDAPISPLVAVTLARWTALQRPEPRIRSLEGDG